MASTTWWQDYLTNKLTETFVCRDTSLDHEPVPSTDRGLITYNSNDAADELVRGGRVGLAHVDDRARAAVRGAWQRGVPWL